MTLIIIDRVSRRIDLQVFIGFFEHDIRYIHQFPLFLVNISFRSKEPLFSNDLNNLFLII